MTMWSSLLLYCSLANWNAKSAAADATINTSCTCRCHSCPASAPLRTALMYNSVTSHIAIHGWLLVAYIFLEEKPSANCYFGCQQRWPFLGDLTLLTYWRINAILGYRFFLKISKCSSQRNPYLLQRWKLQFWYIFNVLNILDSNNEQSNVFGGYFYIDSSMLSSPSQISSWTVLRG